jgi:hypothetical protein
VWGETKIGIKGYFVGLFSGVQQYDTALRRSKDDRHIFLKESQAIGSISLAVLSQQLADFNEGWYPEWWVITLLIPAIFSSYFLLNKVFCQRNFTYVYF